MAAEYGPWLPVLCQKPSLGRAVLQRALTATAAAYLCKADGKLRSIHRGKIDLAALAVCKDSCVMTVSVDRRAISRHFSPFIWSLFFFFPRTTDTLSPFCAISSREMMTQQMTAVIAVVGGVKCLAGDVKYKSEKKRNTSCDFIRILF